MLALDDGSSDGGPERVRGLARRDRRIRLISVGGVGLVGALQRGSELADTPFVARMDADDRCHPDRIGRQLSYMEDTPNVGALGSQVAAEGAGEGLERYVEWQNGLLSPDEHARELFVEAPLCHPSVMLRREALDAVGGYRDVDGPEDYDLWLRLDAAGWQLAKLPEVLLTWCHSEGRATFGDPRYGLNRFRATKAPFLARRALAAGRPVVLWGAGPTGKRMARDLEPHGVRPAFFVDIDPRKIGREARGRRIHGPDALLAGEHFVVAAVGARGARELIRADLQERGFVEGVDALFAA